MNKLELYFNNKDHRVAIAALASHTADDKLMKELEAIEFPDDPIVSMFQENMELKMQNEALKKELESKDAVSK